MVDIYAESVFALSDDAAAAQQRHGCSSASFIYTVFLNDF